MSVETTKGDVVTRVSLPEWDAFESRSESALPSSPRSVLVISATFGIRKLYYEI